MYIYALLFTLFSYAPLLLMFPHKLLLWLGIVNETKKNFCNRKSFFVFIQGRGGEIEAGRREKDCNIQSRAY